MSQNEIEQIGTVEHNVDLTPTVFCLRLKFPNKIEFSPGQAIRLRLPDIQAKDQTVIRYYSIASDPHSDIIEICVKRAGPLTEHLRTLKKGETVPVLVPTGNFTLKPVSDRHMYFIATGTGIAPLRSMALSRSLLGSRPRSVTFLFGARDESDILYASDFSSHSVIRWVVALSRPSSEWKGFRGRVTDYLAAESERIAWSESEFYLCGSSEMVLAVRAFLMAQGVAESSIHHEPYLTPKKTK